MRKNRLVFPLLILSALLAVAATQVSAEEVVYFNNGTSMPIRSHTIENGMVHVDLGDNGFMAFPEYMVERIDGSTVKLKPSTRGPFESDGGMMAVVGSGNVGARRDKAPERVNNVPEKNENVVVDEKTGMAMYKPFRNHVAPNRRGLGATGHAAVTGGPPARTRDQGLIGTRRVGDRFVIGDLDPRQRNRQTQQLIGIERRSHSRRNTQGLGGGNGNTDGGNSGSAGNGGSRGN